MIYTPLEQFSIIMAFIIAPFVLLLGLILYN